MVVKVKAKVVQDDTGAYAQLPVLIDEAHNEYFNMSERFDGRSSDLTLGWLTLKHGQQWEEWRIFASEWVTGQDTSVSAKLDALTLFLETYLAKTAPWASSVCVFFEGYGGVSCSEESFKKAVLQGTRRKDSASLAQLINHIVDFLDWCLDTHFCEPNDNGHLIRVWNNPFKKVKTNCTFPCEPTRFVCLIMAKRTPGVITKGTGLAIPNMRL